MIELQSVTRFAALPSVAEERALPAIPLPDRAPDFTRNVATVRGAAPRAGPGAFGELLLLELLDQRVQRSLEHLRDIA